jgi:predicted ArsR family transcriptional regulator
MDATPAERDALGVLASLGDGVRRALYDTVARRRGPVGRDEAAAAVGVKRSLAAYHLDRLVRDGLLRAHYERPAGRRGPGAGRPAKLYRRSEEALSVCLPPRDYGAAAELLASAVEAGGPRAHRALAERAQQAGERLAEQLRARCPEGATDPLTARVALVALLEERGYEPYLDGRTVRMRNCPFHSLAEAHRDLVCRMNLALLSPVAGCGGSGLRAELDPRPAECCVALPPATEAGT